MRCPDEGVWRLVLDGQDREISTPRRDSERQMLAQFAKPVYWADRLSPALLLARPSARLVHHGARTPAPRWRKQPSQPPDGTLVHALIELVLLEIVAGNGIPHFALVHRLRCFGLVWI